MYSAWFRSTFVKLFKFRQIKEGWYNFLKGTNSAERLKGWRVIFSSFCITILKVLMTTIFRYSVDLKLFYIIQQYFSKIFQILTN